MNKKIADATTKELVEEKEKMKAIFLFSVQMKIGTKIY